MGFSLRRLTGKVLRELTRPFKRIEKRAKQAAQRFVLKTVAQHAPAASVAPGPSAQASSVTVQATHLDSLLYAFLRSGQRNSSGENISSPVTPFAAVSMAAGRILARHPHADFVYVDSDDHRTAALAATGRYDAALSARLEDLVENGSCAYVIGDPIGFHTLSLSRLVGSAGTVIACDKTQSTIKIFNLQANLCRNVRMCGDDTDLKTLPPPQLIVAHIGNASGGVFPLVEQLATHHPCAKIVLHLSDGNLSEHESIQAFSERIEHLGNSDWLPTQFGVQCPPPQLEAVAIDPDAVDWSEPWVLIPRIIPVVQSKAA